MPSTNRSPPPRVLNTLYMATFSAMHLNPAIQRVAQRLRDAGQPPKVVIVAATQKLLILLNPMLRHNLPWNQLDVVKMRDKQHSCFRDAR